MSIRKVLRNIYGNIPNQFLEKNIDQFLPKKDIESIMANFTQTRVSKCLICNNFMPQHQDFPGWVGSIKYDKNGKIINKDILIFGREVASKDSISRVLNEKYKFPQKFGSNFSFIHIWYEFGYDQDATDLINNTIFQNYLFENLNLIFHPLEDYIHRMYGTDLCKCFTNNPYKSSLLCSKEYLIQELNLFIDNNLIFILQGKDVRQVLKNYFRFLPNQDFIKFLDKNLNKLKDTGISCNNKEKEYNFEIGKFYPFGEKKINKSGKYLLIPHSSKQTKHTWNKLFNNKKSGNKFLEVVFEKIKDFLKLV